MYDVVAAIVATIITIIIILVGCIANLFLGSSSVSMSNYSGGAPSADKYQLAAVRKYKSLKPPKVQLSYKQFCSPISYKIQSQQKLVGDYMRPGGGHPDSLLVIHKIGAGKTCLSIQVGRLWRGKKVAGSANRKPLRPLFVMPASLIPGFYNELRSPCAGDDYISAEDRARLKSADAGSPEYASIISDSNRAIDRDFNIMSYNKFTTLSKNIAKLAAPIMIVDEFQNINTPGGKYFAAMKRWVEHYDSPIVLMSATPLFDSVEEIQGIATLMRIGEPITPEDVPRLFAGRISYYTGAPKKTFPKATVKVQKCKMSQHQAKWYHDTVIAEMKKSGNIKLREVAESFYIKSRQQSNIVYPKGLTGQAGLDALTDSIIRTTLETYSTKYAALVKKLRKRRLSFIYSSFTGAGGIACITKVLRAHGYKDYFEDGPGPRRYVVWSGDQTMKEKNTIREVFNSSANDDASQIQVVIGSSAMKEGVSLMRVRQVHIMEAGWNHSSLDQIMGRAIRYCSHKSLPARDRSLVVYIYVAIAGAVSDPPAPTESIDLYMLDIADRKRDLIAPYMDAFAGVAVDRLVHYG
jgi:Helicase conserved C-terminal domain